MTVIRPTWGGEDSSAVVDHLDPEQNNIVPHARTLRNAREQVKHMVIDGISARRIKSYLRRWCAWWVKSSQSWQDQELLGWFLQVCRDASTAVYAAELLQEIKIKTSLMNDLACLNFHATA